MRLYRPTYLLFIAIGSLLLLLSSCTEKEKLSLNIPEGFATNTLKEFARQANVEIIFDPQSVHGVKTNAVNGDHDPQSALRIMLKDTPLTVDFDTETGAYAIIRIKLSYHDNRIPFSRTIAAVCFGDRP